MTTTLKLPSNYEELSQEEMMYLDGGAFSVSTLGRSLRNLWHKFSFASQALRAGGITMGVIASMMKGVASVSLAKIASVLGSIAAANWVVGAVITVVGGTAIAIMGNKVCFA